MTKAIFTYETKRPCGACGRSDVDAVRTPGNSSLLLARHLISCGFCVGSLKAADLMAPAPASMAVR